MKKSIKKQSSLTTKEGEVYELSTISLKKMRPAKDVLPQNTLKLLEKRKIGQRGPQIKPKKIAVTLRYSPEVISYFKSLGPGWQTKMDEILKNWVKRHPCSK